LDRDLEIAAAASAGGLTKWRAVHAGAIGAPCANCQTPLAGPYCHNCGQLAEDFDRSILSLFVEAFENLFHTDGRLFHTLPRLVLRPAVLTRDYIAGRRAAQMPPLRLFLVVVVIFFLAGSLRDIARPRVYRGAPPGAPHTKLQIDDNPVLSSGFRWLEPRLAYARTHQHEFAMAFEGWLHRIAIVFLPVSTLLLSLLFIFQRRFFIFDHAIFSMHSLAFMGLLFTLITLLALALGAWVEWLALVAPIHLFFHMRGFYRTSRWGTLARMFLLFVFSMIALGLLMIGVAALELNGMGGAAA
jgi:hypothetical protein